jgi:HlyD family secretion protein
VGTAQMAGTELLRIADLSAMMVEVEVNENDINRIEVNDSADILIDAFGQRIFRGLVIETAYSSLEKTQTTEQVTSFKVKVRIDSTSYTDLLSTDKLAPFRPGMSASVEIKTRRKTNVVSVPIQSVTLRPDSGFVGLGVDRFDREDLRECIYIIKDGKAFKVKVLAGIQDDKYIELMGGDTLVGKQVIKGPYTELSGKIKSGDLIKVVDEKELFKKSDD